MIKVGLVGEDPNDTLSIKYLLEKRYKTKVIFYQLAKGIKGHHLDSPKLRKSLPIEFSDKKCKFIIYIRDLDAFESQKAKLQLRRKWFDEIDAVINNAGILLLNIWELEALILADINTFNKVYNVDYKLKRTPLLQEKPKELLKTITSHSKKQFKESHCPELFKLLDITKIESNHSSFKSFISEFEEKLSQE